MAQVTSSMASTSVIEMEPIHLPSSSKAVGNTSPLPPQEPLRHSEFAAAEGAAIDGEELPPPGTAANVVQRWNYPRSNTTKIAACFWGFVVMGANDAAYGVGAGEHT
jgi:hypothetical protein